MFWQVVGFIGAGLLVLLHFLLSTGRMQLGTKYQLLQILAAGTLGVSAWAMGFYPTVGLELLFIGISLYAIFTPLKE